VTHPTHPAVDAFFERLGGVLPVPCTGSPLTTKFCPNRLYHLNFRTAQEK
jgi:hypothetical protein